MESATVWAEDTPCQWALKTKYCRRKANQALYMAALLAQSTGHCQETKFAHVHMTSKLLGDWPPLFVNYFKLCFENDIKSYIFLMLLGVKSS